MKSKIFTILALGILIAACKHEPILPAVEEDNTLSLVPCNSDTSYFYNDVVPILVNNCAFAGCHSAVSLSSYNDIVNIGDVVPGDTSMSYIYQVITSTDPNQRMPRPPRAPLTEDQKQTIAKWILQGAKPNACNDCDVNKFQFNANVLPIIVKNCQGCHSRFSPTSGISLGTHLQIKAQADNGKLLGSLKHANGFTAMPPAGKMPDCQITVIEKWINNGAQND